jgi:plasmid stabilization system protein ParE
MKLVWLLEARDDISRLFDFLVDRGPDAALRMLQRVRAGAAILLEFPHAGKRMGEDTERRELFVPFGVGAYVLRYRLRNETIVVIRVWHSRELRDSI